MRRYIVLVILLGMLLLVACTNSNTSNPITSIRFTPLNFPHSNLGEFTLTDSSNPEQLNLFLEVFDHTFSTNKVDDNHALQKLPNTFSLQLFSNTRLVSIYRLSFDFEKDIAFLQNEKHIYSILKEDFHKIIETGYFNMIFRKNHAPTAKFLLNNTEIKYSVNGTWNYETYQNNFISYQINKEQDQNTKYIVTDDSSKLYYQFPSKQPDEIYETIFSSEHIVESKKILNSNEISIPKEEGSYIYEIEGIWSNLSFPYKASLKYQFQIDVNYPPQIVFDKVTEPGNIVAISVANYDSNGKITIQSDLWDKAISLTLLNEKYYGLLPIPLDAEPGDYEINIIGNNSPENLKQTEILSVKKAALRTISIYKKQTNNLDIESERDNYYQGFLKNKINFSADEKLWIGNFSKPTDAKLFASYGQTLKYKDKSYQYLRNSYSINKGEIFTVANGIIRYIDNQPSNDSNNYTILIDHGLGLFTLYSGMNEVNVVNGSYVFAKQKIGSFTPSSTKLNQSFSYSVILHGKYVNPNLFFERDVISLYK